MIYEHLVQIKIMLKVLYRKFFSSDVLSVHIADNDLSFNINLFFFFSVIHSVLDKTTWNETVKIAIGSHISMCKILNPFPRLLCHYEWKDPHNNTMIGNVEDVTVTLKLYNKLVRTGTLKLCYELSQIEESDFGLYNLSVCNTYGCSLLYTHLTMG